LVFGIEDEFVLQADGAEMEQNFQNYRINRIRLAEGFLKRKEFGIWD